MSTDDKHANREATIEAMARAYCGNDQYPIGYALSATRVIERHMRALLDGKALESDADRAALAILQPPDDRKPDNDKRGGR